MASSAHPSNSHPADKRAYRLLRALIRIWFSLFFGKIRFLQGGVLSNSGAAIILVSHPASFVDALILVVALDRQIHCLLDKKLLRGALRGLLAWGLGVISYQSDGETKSLDTACQILADRGAVVVFAESLLDPVGKQPRLAPTAATLALEAEGRCSGQLGLGLFPAYLFLPIAPTGSTELLISIDAPLYPQDFVSASGGDPDEQIRSLAAQVELACRQNPFRLEPAHLEHFRADLEDVFREDLEEEWRSRPNWKQKVDGFRLSRFAAQLHDQLNFLNPGRLVALREFMSQYLEYRRLNALRQLRVETAGDWMQSPGRRVLVGLESAAGFSVACYGLVNHLLIGLVLFALGLLKGGREAQRKLRWAARALIVLAGYGVQIWLCAQWFGRLAAGYYAASLSISGAYMWRYARLFRSRTRALLIAQTIPRHAAKLRRLRKELIEELDAVLTAYAESLGVPH